MNRTRACAPAKSPSTDAPAIGRSVHSAFAGGWCVAVMLAAGLAISLAPASRAQQDKPAHPRLVDAAKPAASPADQPADQPEAPEPAQLPDPSKAVLRILATPYITEQEKQALRLRHGLWLESDLDTPSRVAEAALIRGDFTDPSFDFPDVPPILRAEARLRAGRSADALAILDTLDAATADTLSAIHTRARALETLGRIDDAVKVIDTRIAAGDLGADPVTAVRLWNQRVHLRGSDKDGKFADPNLYKQMLQTLGEFRAGENGRLSWEALLAEAEILYARDGADKAQEALIQLVSLNPSCADAWAMLGRMTVDAFAFDNTEAIAMRLDAIAGNPAPAASLVPDADIEPVHPVASASIDAACLRARAAMRQIDGAEAIDILDPLLIKYPTHPQLLALRAAAEAVTFEFEATRSRLAAFDKLYPGSPVAHYEVGRALAESRQYADSAEMLTEASRRLPAAPEILGELGLMYVQFGKDQPALDALEKAFALDPFNLRVDNSLRLVRELMTYDRVESDHFIVRHKPGIDAAFARDILAGMESNFRIVTGNGPGGIDHIPGTRANAAPQKTVIDLMPDHQWFGVRIAGMPRIHTIAASTGPVIAMEAPREGPGHQGSYDWLRVLRHEYTHTVNLDRSRNRIPHWFTEASAVYLELSPRDYSTCMLLRDVFEADELFDFQQINIAFVRPTKPTDRAQGYAQGHWMYEYIIERWGNRAPLDLMDKYAQGLREEQAFQAVLGVSRSQFMDEFKPWARRQLVDWGMLPPAGQPTIAELLEKVTADHAPTPTPDAPDEEPAPAPQPEASKGDSPTSPEIIAQWLKDHPAHPDVLELAVDQAAEAASNRATAEMLPLLERYAQARPVDPKPHRLLAQYFLASTDSSDAGKAIAQLEYLDAREQKTPAYAIELAKRYFARNAPGDLANAMAKAERATQVSPYSAPPRELAATIAIKAGDLAAAERHILALTILEPTRPIHQQRLEAVRKMLNK